MIQRLTLVRYSGTKSQQNAQIKVWAPQVPPGHVTHAICSSG